MARRGLLWALLALAAGGALAFSPFVRRHTTVPAPRTRRAAAALELDLPLGNRAAPLRLQLWPSSALRRARVFTVGADGARTPLALPAEGLLQVGWLVGWLVGERKEKKDEEEEEWKEKK